MPRATIYIREGDVEKWEIIDNKSEWISDALNGDFKESKVTMKMTKPKQPSVHGVSKSFNTCKNGHILSTLTGRCTQKDCKYA